MPIARFTFGQTPVRRMEVHWSALGFEKYVLDGKLLAKRWSIGLSGEETFVVDGSSFLRWPRSLRSSEPTDGDGDALS
jgi:hypothetical protein